MKCEPGAYSIDDLKRDQTTFWNGVRNYQARNFMRDQMQVGDMAFFYHSNAEPSGIVGLIKINKAGYPDYTSWDPKHKYFDPKSPQEKPLWYMVDVNFIEKFQEILPLQKLKTYPELRGMELLRQGSRLSVQPVSEANFKFIISLAK